MEQIHNTFLKHKNSILAQFNLVSSDNPVAFLLGGQPASGKSDLIKIIQATYEENFLVINGDDIRCHHPDYKELIKNIEDFSRITQPYSNIFTENLINEAIKNNFNVIIEGTMRNPNIPIKTANLLKNNNFKVHAAIIASHPIISELALYERFYNEVLLDGYGRLADINSHNQACTNLLKSADMLYNSNSVDTIQIFSNYPIAQIHNLPCSFSKNNSTLPSTLIERQRTKQIQQQDFLNSRINAAKNLLLQLNPSLKMNMIKIISDLKALQKNASIKPYRRKM
jgi:hypothetical protein